MAILEDVEWGGDFVTGVVIACLVLGLVGFGFAWGKWRALIVLAAAWTVLLVISDVLYYGLGTDLVGYYCGEPKCDPGPFPAIIMLFYLPFAMLATALGVVVRRRRVSGQRRKGSIGVRRR